MLPGMNSSFYNSLVSIDDYYGHPKQPVLPQPPRGTMPHPSYNPHVKLAIESDPKEIQVEKKKRKKSIEGENIPDIISNIIKEKPGNAMVRKAFKKMASIVEEKNDEKISFDI